MSNLIFNKDELDKFTKIFKNLAPEDEFEIMFGGYTKTKSNSLNMKQFLDILKYLKLFADEKKFKIEHNEMLDLSYNYDNINLHNYRISINGVDKINSLMATLHERENHIIFSILVSKILSDNSDDLSIINKKKDYDNIYNLEKHDIRVRLSKELKVTKKELSELINLDNVTKIAIMLRMKSRFSIIIENNSDVEIRIDLTSVRQGNNVNNIQIMIPNFELEIDFNKKKTLTAAKEKKYMETLLNYINFVKKIIDQTNIIISNEDKINVLSVYNKLLLQDSKINSKYLYGNQTKSLEVVHIVDNLPNKYAVTDKADGDRYLGIITNNKFYLISTNLEVKYSGIEFDKQLSKYNNTILDGEYIYNSTYNKYIFAAFDILYYQGNNIQDEILLEERYKKLNDVIQKCFNFDFNYNKYNGVFEFKLIEKYYKNDISNYLTKLMDLLKKTKNETFVCQKYFIFVLGGSDSEIFKYSSIIWNMYTKSNAKDVPYILDGLIYTPLNQIYTKSLKDTKHRIYKWKPPNKNSIDFFIRFEKDKQTGKYLNVFDDTNEDGIDGSTYKIINLHVGKIMNNIETPVLFRKFDNLHIAKISDSNGVVRDIEGDLLQDNTVVEFYYNNDINISPNFRWVPIRTRYDKTEAVLRHKKKYGNNIDVANSIWNSMQENVTINDLLKLGDEESYEKEIHEIKKRIDATTVAIEKQQDIYYQKTSKVAEAFRNFHNYIKSNIIYAYCSPKIINNNLKKMSILDVGVGKGGDILKFFSAKIGKYVGIDPDAHGINSSTDGAISRYNNFRTKFPQFPKMDFFVADAGTEFNFESQSKVIGKMSDHNKTLVNKTFGSDLDNLTNNKFDVFNCQMMIHFLLKDDETWNNFCNNINNYLEEEGYLLITTFDGELLNKKFNENNGIIESLYTDEGKKKQFFEYKSNYNFKDKNININKTGLSYNAYISLFKEEGHYDTEYIVSQKFLVDSLRDKCNMSLIEAQMFDTIYDQKKYFFENVAPKEENYKSKNFFMKIAEYYNLEDEINKAGLEVSKLHKYYIFKKNMVSSNTKVSKIISQKTNEKTNEKPNELTKILKINKTSKTSKMSKTPKTNKPKINLINKYLNTSNVIDI